MDKDTRRVKDLAVYELQELITNVPKHYFSAAVREACLQINKGCKKDFKEEMHTFAGEITGTNTREVEGRDKARGVYKFAEGQQDKSKFLGKQVAIESVKWIGIFIAIILGLKNSG